MRKYMAMLAGLMAGIIMGGGGMAIAAGTFDSSKPPTLAPWMTRPCKTAPLETARRYNCYWNDTMGLTDGAGNDIHTGFWIYKLPHQPLVCYIYSPDDRNWANGRPYEKCYGTTTVR